MLIAEEIYRHIYSQRLRIRNAAKWPQNALAGAVTSMVIPKSDSGRLHHNANLTGLAAIALLTYEPSIWRQYEGIAQWQ